MATKVQPPPVANRRDTLQPHIPRLTYRNACPTASLSRNSFATVESERTESSTATVFTSAATPSILTVASSPQSSRFPPSAFSLDGASDEHTLSTSFAPASKLPEVEKKKGSILKFFTVKEPSSKAFEEYQEQMKKRGTTQGGRVTAVGLPGVSSAKLPPTVPKVNSKWDGVPVGAKDRDRSGPDPSRQSMASSGNRQTHTSRSAASDRTVSTADSDLRFNGKLQYNNSNGSLSDMYGWETAIRPGTSSTKNFSLDPPRTANSGSAMLTPASDRSSFFPPVPPSIPEAYLELASATTPPPLEPPNRRSSPAQTSASPSPITPSDFDTGWPLPTPPTLKTASDDIKTTTIEVPSLSSHKGVLLNSPGVRVLGPPASAKRRPTPAPFLAGEAQELKLSPSPSFISSPSDIQPQSILKKSDEPPPSADWPLPAQPPQDTKLLQRHNSARERLKLGMTLRNASTPLWNHEASGTDGGASSERATSSTQGTSKTTRKRPKLSIFNRAS
ncbi:MAG: hypothetical protein Q9190_007194 [Brigantiaea leucoxantha]